MNAIVRNIGELVEARRQAGILIYLLVAIWVLYPTAIVTVFHPSDAVGFQLWLQGFVVPHFMTPRAINAGAAVAVAVLVALSLLQLGVVTLIYRRLQFYVQFWPLALFLIGFVSNSIWWIKTGAFDPEGALAGLSPLVAAVACHGVCERWGGNFVFGPGAKPHYQPEY